MSLASTTASVYPSESSRQGIKLAAVCWSVALWLPIIPSYIAIVSLWIYLLSAPDFAERLLKARKHLAFCSALGFASWIAVSAIVHIGKTQTLAALFHVFFFLLTLASGLMLTRDEALAAWKTFLLTSSFMLTVLLVHCFIHPLPLWHGIKDILYYDGNKAIRAGLLVGLSSASALAYLLWEIPFKKGKLTQGILALTLFAVGAGAILLYIPCKTSIILYPLAIGTIVLHRVLTKSAAIIALLFITSLSLVVANYAPNVKETMGKGRQGLAMDIQREHPVSTAGLRYHLYQFSIKKIKQHPLLGSGIGAWKEGWAALHPHEDYANFRNPHNDYLLYGTEAGLPASLFLFSTYLIFFIYGYRQRSMWGGIAASAAMIAGCTCFFNAGMRDAVFCLSLVWLMASTHILSRTAKPNLNPNHAVD